MSEAEAVPPPADPAAEATPAPSAPRRERRGVALAVFGGSVAAAALVGSRFGPRPGSATQRWYRALRTPPFQPPPQVFAPVWTVLYASIAASGYRVWRAPDDRNRSAALALWGAQMVANAAWTPTFFGARRPGWALGVLTAQLSTTCAYSIAAARTDPPAAALVAPYIGWSAFAFALNEEIVRRNRRT